MKLFIILMLGLFSLVSKAELKARWTGVAGLILEDETHKLVFDTIITKPKLTHWLFNEKFLPDENQHKAWLKELDIKIADAFFVSHTHFDHAVDVPNLALLTGGTIYGGESLRLVSAKLASQAHFRLVQDGEVLSIGKFKVTMLKRYHAKIGGFIDFLAGPIEKTFDASFYQYLDGEVWCYRIEHPEGVVLVDQGSHFFASLLTDKPVLAYFAGIANKKNLDDLLMNNLLKVNAKYTIPLHFDHFLIDISWLEGSIMPNMDLAKIESTLKEKNKLFIIPKKNQFIKLVP